MTHIRFTSTTFDTKADGSDQSSAGLDVAEWVLRLVHLEKGRAFEEYWGWAVYGRFEGHRVVIGIYDHHVTDTTPRWVLRVFDDSFAWNPLTWFSSREREAPPELRRRLLEILKSAPEVSSLEEVEE